MAPPLLIDQLHRYYGDQQIGIEEYAASKRWMALVEKQYPDGIVTEGLSDHEALEASTSAEMVTPLYFECANILAAIAGRLSLTEDAAHYRQLAAKIRDVYTARFIDSSTGKVGAGTQACQSFALYTGIAPEAARTNIVKYLLTDIRKHKGHLTTGILGTKFMLDVLSREGHAEVAYQIVTQPDFPGWGWMLKNGATTLWEHWEYSNNTFSHNHPMFGSVSQWMVNWLGGIQPENEADGFDRIVIRPQTPSGLDWVKSSYRSIRGMIVSNWHREGSSIRFEFEIPNGVQAKLFLPSGAVKTGGPKSPSTKSVGRETEVSTGSGRLTFELANPNKP